MVNAVESLTFQLVEGEKLPKNQEEAEAMYQDHQDDYNAETLIGEICNSDLPHGFTTGEGSYTNIEGEG